MAVQVQFESLYISLPSFAKQQREMTKSCALLGACTAMVCFSCLPFEFYAIIPHSAWAGFYADRRTEQTHTVATFQGKILLFRF